MGRSPCCDMQGLKKGVWTKEEDRKLISYIKKHGEGGWRFLPQKAGLLRCGKSCRLRWANYLRPGIRRGEFSAEEEQTIIRLHAALGNRWATIARHLYRRTDNEVKNYWNTRLKKRAADITMDHPVADRNSANPVKLTNKPEHIAGATSATELIPESQLYGTFLIATEDNTAQDNHVPTRTEQRDNVTSGTASRITSTCRIANTETTSISVHPLDKVVTTLTPNVCCPNDNGTIGTVLTFYKSLEGNSTSSGSTTTSSATISTNVSDFDQAISESNTVSSARILNKIASRMGELNLRHALVDCPADATSSCIGHVGDQLFPFHGGLDLRSPATDSSATSNNVEVIYEDTSVSTQARASEMCGGPLVMCQQSMEFQCPIEEFLSQSTAPYNAKGFYDDILDADLEQVLITSFFNGG